MTFIRGQIVQNRAGMAVGLPCFCTANEHVLRAILNHARDSGAPTVIEATCNQVNQEGGYTGLTPQDYATWLREMADEVGVAWDQIILGGDHLGPNPWRAAPPDAAMDKAKELVRHYVEAGFTKIHLDASMACGDEPNPSFETIASRAADLCAVAEEHAPAPDKLIYVIGTEVPIPGGETEEPDALDVTSVERFQQTIITHRDAFDARDLRRAWDSIVAIVTQPGVDFGHSSIYPFAPDKAQHLSQAILDQNGLVFEAHSTDYQSTAALHDLVRGHFFFLKVGPELTFRFREAVWALTRLDDALGGTAGGDLRKVIEAQMTEQPAHWQPYYQGTPEQIMTMRQYSYSDRIRYYWTDPKIAAALDTLLAALDGADLPETVISQEFMGLDFGSIPKDPRDLIMHHVQTCVSRYFRACGHG